MRKLSTLSWGLVQPTLGFDLHWVDDVRKPLRSQLMAGDAVIGVVTGWPLRELARARRGDQTAGGGLNDGPAGNVIESSAATVDGCLNGGR